MSHMYIRTVVPHFSELVAQVIKCSLSPLFAIAFFHKKSIRWVQLRVFREASYLPIALSVAEPMLLGHKVHPIWFKLE